MKLSFEFTEDISEHYVICGCICKEVSSSNTNLSYLRPPWCASNQQQVTTGHRDKGPFSLLSTVCSHSPFSEQFFFLYTFICLLIYWSMHVRSEGSRDITESTFIKIYIIVRIRLLQHIFLILLSRALVAYSHRWWSMQLINVVTMVSMCGANTADKPQRRRWVSVGC